jgi:hypothetical protein
MKTKLVLACAALLAAPAVWAAPPSDESLRTLFRVMNASSMLDAAYAQLEPAMRQGMNQAAAGKPLHDEQRKVLDLAPQRLSALMRAELSWEKLEPIQMQIYRESFEQFEIDGLIAFYSSPAGQAFVNKMPVVMQKSMTLMQGTMQQLAPKLQASMQQILEEAKLAPPR